MRVYVLQFNLGLDRHFKIFSLLWSLGVCSVYICRSLLYLEFKKKITDLYVNAAYLATAVMLFLTYVGI